MIFVFLEKIIVKKNMKSNNFASQEFKNGDVSFVLDSIYLEVIERELPVKTVDKYWGMMEPVEKDELLSS